MKIKVIKKNEVKPIAQQPIVSENNQQHLAATRMISTVSNWVNEFQERRVEEKEAAIKQFSGNFQTGITFTQLLEN